MILMKTIDNNLVTCSKNIVTDILFGGKRLKVQIWIANEGGKLCLIELNKYPKDKFDNNHISDLYLKCELDETNIYTILKRRTTFK